ncbi:hypothetical protein LP419_22355 [Massilia sp. H-1]|nr:hypothetical protein LP419_22355 [Massilia sp. H-1]
MLAALVASPETWSKTVFLLTYDENDGFFDHMPAHVPPLTTAMGRTTLPDIGQYENYQGIPVGLGPRVPMLIVSPWTKGGRVCSQLFDHTSQLRFLEEWLVARGKVRNAIACNQISPWRRTVSGDLTSAFDFKNPNTGWLSQRAGLDQLHPGQRQTDAGSAAAADTATPGALQRPEQHPARLRAALSGHGRRHGDWRAAGAQPA